MAIKRPEIIDHLTSLGSSPGITPSPGPNRIYMICDIAETGATGVMTAATIGGVNATIIHQFATATMNFYLYYIDEAGIQAMVGTDVTRTGASLAASFVTRGVVFQYVDQTTPFVNVEDQGYSGKAQNSTGTIDFTLDEIVDGLGVLFGGNSKTTGTWTYGSYTEYAAPATDGSNMAAVFATKATSAVAAGVTDNLVNSLPADKTCAVAVMLQPGEDAGTPPPSDPGSSLELASFEGVGTVIHHTGSGGVALTNQSDVTWSETLQNWLAVTNSTGTIFKYNEAGVYQGQVTKSGNTTSDVEGLTHYQGDEYLLSNENNQIWKVTIDATTTNVDLQVGSNQSYTLPARGLSNKGTEGVAVNPVTGDVWAVQESDPMRIYHFILPADKPDFAAYDEAVDLTVDEPFDPEVLYAGLMLDLASVEFDPITGNLLLLSERSQLILEVDANDGSIIDRLTVPPDTEGGFTQPEGLYLGFDEFGNRFLKIWGEPDESQTWKKIVIGGSGASTLGLNSISSGLKAVSGSISQGLGLSKVAAGIKRALHNDATNFSTSSTASGNKNALANDSQSTGINSSGAGQKNTLASVSTSAGLGESNSGSKRAFGSSSVSLALSLTASGTAQTSASGDAAISLDLSSSVTAFKRAFGSSSASLGAVLNASGKKVGKGSAVGNLIINSSASGFAGVGASGSVVSNLSIGSSATGKKTTSGSSSFSLAIDLDSSGIKKALSSNSFSLLVDLNSSGIKQAFGSVSAGMSITLSNIGEMPVVQDIDLDLIRIYSSTERFTLKAVDDKFNLASSNHKFTII